ncbi:MAG: hypothetical protein ACE1ZQ_12900 [Ignavibacteriaceae bacterium]
MGIFKQTKDKITAASENAVKKTKLVADFAMEKASNVMNDENIADFVISATKKQESINEELKKKKSPYRLGEMELELSIPPSISFSIRRLEKETISKKTDVQRTDQPNCLFDRPALLVWRKIAP